MSPNLVVAEILADSFLHYPLMLYAFEGCTVEQRSKALLQLYKRCTSAAAMYGGVIKTPDKQGALIWLPGESFPLGLWKEIRSGMGAIPFKLGAKTTLRLMNHDAVSEGWIRKHADDKMGYIWCLGVAAAARGKGYSRLLVDQSIAQMKANGMTSFWLKTDDLKNVAIYQALGFEIMFETRVKSSGLKSWVFKRN